MIWLLLLVIAIGLYGEWRLGYSIGYTRGHKHGHIAGWRHGHNDALDEVEMGHIKKVGRNRDSQGRFVASN